jgi:hypothetical protein
MNFKAGYRVRMSKSSEYRYQAEGSVYGIVIYVEMYTGGSHHNLRVKWVDGYGNKTHENSYRECDVYIADRQLEFSF